MSNILKKAEFDFRCPKCKVHDNVRVGYEYDNYTCFGYGTPEKKLYDLTSNGYCFHVEKPIFICRSCGAIIPWTEDMLSSYNKMIVDLINKETKSREAFKITWMEYDKNMKTQEGKSGIICVPRQTEGMLNENELKEEFVDMLWNTAKPVYESYPDPGLLKSYFVKFINQLLYNMEFGEPEKKFPACYKLIPQPTVDELSEMHKNTDKYHSKEEVDILNHELWKLFIERDPDNFTIEE